MKCCCIPSCPKPTNLACYDIPSDVQRREQWLTSINSDHLVLTITDEDILSICSLHFKQSDYVYLFCDDQSSKRKIREDAVPSIFPWTSDWDSNYTAEMEVAELYRECSQQGDCSKTIANTGLPEGEAVQLGNVESLGITTPRISTEDDACKENPSAHSDLNSEVDTGRLKNLLVTSIPSASFSHVMQLSASTSNTTSRVESSDDEDIKIFNILPEKFQYSCTECEFKSPDIISLKDHRMKSHPYGSRSEPTSANQTVNSFLGLSMCETPIRQSRDSPISSSSSGSIVKYLDKSGRRRPLHSCTQCSYTTKGNNHTLQEHIKKKHSLSASNIADHSKSNRPSPSSTSSSTLDCPRPPKRAVRKWYLCSECSFRTPNAKKLKAHLREDHPYTPNSLDSEATKPTTSKQSEKKTNEVRLDIDRSDLKKLKLNGQLYYLCPGENCSVRAKDSAYVLRHYQKNHFTPKSEKRTDSVTPKEEMVELSPIASPRLKTKSTDETMKSDERDRFFCKLCKFSTVKKTNLKQHETRHGNNAPYQCKMCSYSVDGSRQLAFHITNHHQEGFPCSLCDFRAKSWNSKKSHEATVHKVSTTVKTATCASEEPSDLDHDIEYACSHCSYKTPSRERFLAHEKTHLPDVVESSTEELSVESIPKVTRALTSIKKLKRKRDEPEESISSGGTIKLIERLVYQCPLCSYWARTVTNFHQHFIAHEKTPAFKCSVCDYSARYRRNVTRHITNSSKTTHKSACWVLIKSVPENQYPEYLKTAYVPECSYSGKSLTPTNAISNGKPFETKSSDSSENRSRTTSESFPEGSSDDESHEWIPSSPSIMKDIDSSSPSFVPTPDASSEYEEKPSSLCSPTSESKSEHSSESSASSDGFNSRIVLRSSSKKNNSPRRKRLRIDSNESGEANEPLPRSKMKALPAPPLKNTERKNGILSIVDQKLEIKMKLKIPSSFPKGPFPSLEEALAKRQKDEQKISEMRQKINRMRAKQDKTKERDELSQSELLKLKERKSVVNKLITKLNGKKIEAELQVRTQQCRELKLSLDMYDPEQQEAGKNTEELAEIKKLVAELEVKLALITKEIANLQEENEDLDRQIKDTEESHAGAAQLFEILQSELSEKESELTSFEEELTEADARVAELVNKERKEITTLTEICEDELKKAYMRGLSEIREREQELLNALEQFVKEKSDSPNIDESV